MNAFRVLGAPFRFILLGCIRAYKMCLSPFIGNGCIYTPTCSTYAAEAIREWGAVRGSWLALKRILRCVPWKEGGIDPVPDNPKGDMKWLF